MIIMEVVATVSNLNDSMVTPTLCEILPRLCIYLPEFICINISFSTSDKIQIPYTSMSPFPLKRNELVTTVS